ncbi:MAG TPA: hypothetical protein VFE50_13335 [Cyclobacteriaceae bacterium]|nr:hypothetical protein [Cyclobacteriaceae bacterium]
MAYTSHIPLTTFREVSIGDKAKAITMFGTLLTTTTAFGMDFFLYAIDNYFVEVTSVPRTGDVIYIKASEKISIVDMYLDNIEVSEVLK